MSKKIISEIANRDAFFHLLGHNPGLIILKLGATWCGPCKQIEHIVHAFFASSPANVVCGDNDVDISFDFYALLTSKKMVNGSQPLGRVPVLGLEEGSAETQRVFSSYSIGLHFRQEAFLM